MNIQEIVLKKEQTLYQAMMKSDVPALDALLDDKLIFTDHMGNMLGKSDDINAHKSGIVSVESIETSELKITAFLDWAIVSVLMNIRGKYLNVQLNGKFRYTRIWANKDDNWKIVAAHSSLINK